MTKDKTILIQNIYYMLTYAFTDLRHTRFEKVKTEKLDSINDLLAFLLILSLSKITKQSLLKVYIEDNQNLIKIKGRINVKETINNISKSRVETNCDFDDLSENNLFNQILKTTIEFLLRDRTVKDHIKAKIKRFRMFFSNVDSLEPKTIHWENLVYRRENSHYQTTINICFLVLKRRILSTDVSNDKSFEHFMDQHMQSVFEKFVLNYYKYHYFGSSLKIISEFFDWAVENRETNPYIFLLPKMKTDISITDKESYLVIDTKYYSRVTIQHRGKNEFHSQNLYQIFSYVKNIQATRKTNKVSGVLLYAKTEVNAPADSSYDISGNKFLIKTLDLNKDSNSISEQLDSLISLFFPNEMKTRV